MNSETEPKEQPKPDPERTVTYTRLMASRWGLMCGLTCDPCITGAILNFGEYAPVETEILTSLVRLGDTVIDVGANVGAMSLALANVVGNNGKVVAIEPQRVCFMCLCANVALNSWVHVIHPVYGAAGKERGSVEIPLVNVLGQNVNVGGFSLRDDYGKKGELVELLTIDSLKLEKVRLIKADVEGMEADVLRGAQDTIKANRPIIWAEQLDFRKFTREALKAILDEFGYKAWKLHTPAYIPTNARRRLSDPFGAPIADPNVIAFPAEMDEPAWIHSSAGVEVFV